MKDKYRCVQSYVEIRMSLTSMIRESLASCGGDQYSKINHDDARALVGRKM